MSIETFPAKFGKYILLDRLNAGGMAEVFRAKVTGVEGFERLVAIKCMLPALLSDEQFSNMFVDEARLAAQLTHANVAQIYELGRQAERLYIAMELVSGRDLRHIIKTANAQGQPLPPDFAAYVCSKAAEGLDFAHRKVGNDGRPLGLVHRDISPQNIIVSYDGEVKVVDFGIAKANSAARDTHTQVGVLKGKFAYMSPEQVLGHDIDRRADIFALGSVLYEMVTGSRLFTGESDLTVLERVREGALPDLNIVLPQNAATLIPVFQKALQVNPEQRFGWASEMSESLEPMLMGERSIFGPKRAAALMRQMFAADIVELAEKLKKFSSVTESSCVSVIGAESTEPGTGGRMVFESTFASKRQQEAAAERADTGVVPRDRVSSEPAAAALEATQRAPVPVPARATARVPNAPNRVVVPRPAPRTEAQANAPTQMRRPAAEEPTRAADVRVATSPFEPTVAPQRPRSTATLDVPARPGPTVVHNSARPAPSTVRDPLPRSAYGVRRRLTWFMAASTVALVGAVLVANANMPTPLTVDDAMGTLQDLHPLARAEDGLQRLRNARLVDRWVFGSNRADVPEVQSTSRFSPAAGSRAAGKEGATLGMEPSAALDAPALDENAVAGEGEAAVDEGFLQVTVLGAETAHVSVDAHDLGLAPTPPLRLKVGTHTVRVERQRADGSVEHKESRVRVGLRHTQAEPMAVTLAF